MTKKKNTNFSWRSFTSLYIAMSFIVMVVSGIILYLAPPGRISHWSYWSLLGLTKTEWQAIHTIFTFLFIAAGGFHIYFNWKPLIHYLKTKKTAAAKIRIELLSALFSGLLVFTLTLAKVPPFSTVMDFGEYLTESWENENNAPPIPHAEKLTIEEFSKSLNIPIEKILKKFKDADINFLNTQQTIEEISEVNKLTPNNLYDLVKTTNSNNSSQVMAGNGYGRKTIAEICNELNINEKEALARLEKKNITAESSVKLKDLASEHNMLPIEIFNLLTNQ